MSVTLIKCAFGCKDKRPEEFSGKHTNYGDPICDWCGWMWVHDRECCKSPQQDH